MKSTLSQRAKLLIVLCLIAFSFILITLTKQYAVLLGVIYLNGALGVFFQTLFALSFCVFVFYFATQKPFLRKLSKILLIVLLINTLVNLFGLVFFAEELLPFIAAMEGSGVTEFHLVIRYLLGVLLLGFLWKEV